jgi:hypothetical protein
MNLLWAHHLELQHVPVLTVFFGVGVWVGWHLLSKLLNRSGPPNDTSSPPVSH